MRMGWMGQVLLLVVGLAAAAGVARGESSAADALARKGNQLFDQERYDEAIEAYREALKLDPSPRIQYNLGTALAKKGRYDEAEQALAHAAETPGPINRTDAFFNLGVTLADRIEKVAGALGFGGSKGPGAQGTPPLRLSSMAPSAGEPTPAPPSSATPDAESALTPQQQLKKLNDSLGAFRESILASPGDTEAKHNYEVVQDRIRLLKEQLQQQQQKQSSQGQKDNQQQEKGKQQKDQQQKQDQKNQQQQGEQKQDQKNQQQAGEQKKDQGGQQQDKDKARQESGLEGAPTPQPTPGAGAQKKENRNKPQANTGEAAQAGETGQEKLTPEQMDALRILNLLEKENPEQFKKLYQFKGKPKPLEKDW